MIVRGGVTDRQMVYLARLGDVVEEDGSLGLPVNPCDADLGLRVGAGRRSVVAALRDWRSRGVVKRRHGKLVIKNLGILIKAADIPTDPCAGARNRRRRRGG